MAKKEDKKEYKSISWIQRVMDNAYKVFSKFTLYKRQEYVKTKTFDPNTNRIVKRSEKRYVDNSNIKKYKVSDFCLENLQAIGADKDLCSFSLSPNRFETIKNIETKLEKMSKVNNDNNNA